MPNPKRRHSSTRRDKRRTHDSLTPATISFCQATGEPHLSHRAHWHEGKLYHKGKVVMEKQIKEKNNDSDDEE